MCKLITYAMFSRSSKKVDTDTLFVFGLMLIGEGQIWLDDVSFEAVSKEVPLTGKK